MSVLIIEAVVIGVAFDSFIVAAIYACSMLLYMDIIGEAHDRYAMRCELLKEKDDAQSHKVMKAYENIKRKAEILYPSVEGIELYCIPTDEINAYSFGRTSIAITRGAMSLDAKTIEGLLSHELGHSLNADMFFYRFLFGNLVSIMFLIGMWNMLIIGGVVLIIMLIMICTAMRFTFVTYQISNFAINILQNILTGIRNLLLSVGQAIIAVISRNSEYKADEFASKLGYGKYLSLFLSKYVIDYEGFKPRTYLEVIYASHPEPVQRIKRLQKLEQ